MTDKVTLPSLRNQGQEKVKGETEKVNKKYPNGQYHQTKSIVGSATE